MVSQVRYMLLDVVVCIHYFLMESSKVLIDANHLGAVSVEDFNKLCTRKGLPVSGVRESCRWCDYSMSKGAADLQSALEMLLGKRGPGGGRPKHPRAGGGAFG